MFCPLNGITPGNFGNDCEVEFILYSSSGVCVDSVAALLEDELFVKMSGSLDVPLGFEFLPTLVTLSSVDEGVNVDAIVAEISMDSCCDWVFSGNEPICATSGTRVGTLDARFSTCCIWNIIVIILI